MNTNPSVSAPNSYHTLTRAPLAPHEVVAYTEGRILALWLNADLLGAAEAAGSEPRSRFAERQGADQMNRGRKAGATMRLRRSLGAITSLASLIVVLAAAASSLCVAAPPQWKRIGPQGAQTLVAAVDPAVADRAYAATLDEVHVSLDGGLIFSKLTSLAIEKTAMRPSAYVIDIAVLRASPESTVPTSGEAHIVVQLNTPPDAPSLYVSPDGGRSWMRGLDSVTGKPIRGNWKKLAAVPGSASVAFAIGGYSSGNFRTDDGGSTWRPFPVPQGLRGPTRLVPVTESLLVIADETGLFRTTDGGTSWTAMSAGLPAPPYSYLAVAADPHVPTTLGLVIADEGTFRSTDAGATWAQHGGRVEPATWMPTDLFIDGESLWVVVNGLHNFRSRDRGRTWTDLNDAPNAALGAILARDAITGRLYFSTASEAAGYLGNLSYSVDDGDTLFPSQRGLQVVDLKYIAVDKAGRLYAWSGSRLLRREPLQDGWSDVTPALHGGCGGYYGPGPIVVAEDDTLFATGPAGILRSSDGGDNWTSTPAPEPAPANWYCLLAVAPGNHGVLYSRIDVYGRGMILYETHVFRSSDGGIVWSRINQPYAIIDRLHAVDENRLLALGRSGLASSRDGGSSWSLAFSAVRDFVASASHPEVVVVADDSGIYRSDDGGGTFARLGNLPDARVAQVAVDPRLQHVVYAVTDQGRVYRSTDAGATWGAVEARLDSLVDVYDVVATAATPSTLIASTSHGVYASTRQAISGSSLSFIILRSDTIFCPQIPTRSGSCARVACHLGVRRGGGSGDGSPAHRARTPFVASGAAKPSRREAPTSTRFIRTSARAFDRATTGCSKGRHSGGGCRTDCSVPESVALARSPCFVLTTTA